MIVTLVTRIFWILFYWIVTLVSYAIFRILFHWIVTLVSCALLGFCFIGFLRQYLVHVQDSLSSDCYVSMLYTVRNLLNWIVTSVSRGLQDFLSSDCYVGILRTFRILFHRIVLLISRTLLGVSFIGLFRQYLTLCQDSSFIGLLRQHLTHFQVSHLLDCYVGSLRIFRIVFYWIVTQYLAHFQDSLSFGCYFSFSHTLRLLYHWVVTLVSRTHLGFSFIGLLCQYLMHL